MEFLENCVRFYGNFKGQNPRPLEIPHHFFLVILGNSTQFLINPGKFHMLFLWQFAVLARFFTCVSWGISPAQIFLIVQNTAIRPSIFCFSSFSMFIQSRISKSVVICSLCSFLCSFLLSFFSILLSSTLLSISCSVFSLCLFTLFSDLRYCFLFKSVILSFLFS